MKYKHLVVHEDVASAVKMEAKRRGVTITKMVSLLVEELTERKVIELPPGEENEFRKRWNDYVRNGSNGLQSTISVDPIAVDLVGIVADRMGMSKKDCVLRVFYDRYKG